MPLDIRITFIAIAVSCFLFTGGLYFFQTREFRRNGVLEWIVGQFLLGVYWVFLGLRGLIPDFLSILVANVCLSASYSYLYVAVRKFQHCPYRRDLFFLPAAATILFFLFFWAYTDNMFARSVYITFVSGMQTGFIASILLRDASLQVRRSQWFTGCMFALVAALWFIRFFELLISPGQRIIFPDTNPFWTVVLILGSGVVILLSIGALLMIRERSEEDLRESEGNYRGLFKNASIGIFHSLPEGLFLRVNPALAHMLGYGSPEEVISTITNISTQIYVDSKKRPALLTTTLENDGWVHAENRYRRKDGTILTATLAVRKVLNSDGTIAYLEGFVEDITER